MQDLDAILRMAVAALVMTLALVALRLITGNRELAQMTSFDLVMLMAFGMLLGAVLVFKTSALGEGVLALAVLLLALQQNQRNPPALPSEGRRAPSEPIVLLYDGQVLPTGIESGAATDKDVSEALRVAGHQDAEEVEAVVLEPGGSMNVIGPRGASSLVARQVVRASVPSPSRGQT